MESIDENEDTRTPVEKARALEGYAKQQSKKWRATMKRRLRELQRKPSDEARKRVLDAADGWFAAELRRMSAFQELSEAIAADLYPEETACIEEAQAARRQEASTQRSAVRRWTAGLASPLVAEALVANVLPKGEVGSKGPHATVK